MPTCDGNLCDFPTPRLPFVEINPRPVTDDLGLLWYAVVGELRNGLHRRNRWGNSPPCNEECGERDHSSCCRRPYPPRPRTLIGEGHWGAARVRQGFQCKRQI